MADIDGDGKDEIIAGSEAKPDGNRNDVVVLDGQGALQWHILVHAPVLEVVAVGGGTEQPRLFIAESECALRVTEVNPPGSVYESEVKQRAQNCMAALATEQAIEPDALLSSWLDDPPTSYLHAFALDHLASEGDMTALSHLVQIEIKEQWPSAQRAYTRSLVNAAVNTLNSEHPDNALPLLKRLAGLLSNPRNQEEASASALRGLLLPGRLTGSRLERWIGVLQAAAGHPLAHTRRMALQVLLRLLPESTLDDDFSPDIWEILRTALNPGSDLDEWVLEEVAIFLRNSSPSPGILWKRACLTGEKMSAPAILEVLSNRSPSLLTNPELRQAIGHLAALYHSETESEGWEALQAIVNHLDKAEVPKNSGAMVDIYYELVRAGSLKSHQAWTTFVSNHNTAQSFTTMLRRLQELSPAHQLELERVMNYEQ